MPIKTVTYIICDWCDKNIPEGDDYWDFSTYGVVFCKDCMINMHAFEFADKLLSGDYPHDFKYRVECGKKERGWAGSLS